MFLIAAIHFPPHKLLGNENAIKLGISILPQLPDGFQDWCVRSIPIGGKMTTNISCSKVLMLSHFLSNCYITAPFLNTSHITARDKAWDALHSK